VEVGAGVEYVGAGAGAAMRDNYRGRDRPPYRRGHHPRTSEPFTAVTAAAEAEGDEEAEPEEEEEEEEEDGY
jgi:hypothetical protein